MLKLENFLDKDDKRKFEFLRLLEESSELTELNTVIQYRLELSNFLFGKTIEELNNDFNEYGLETFFSLKNDTVQTTLLEVGQATSDLLLELYLKNSLTFSILSALFQEEFQSTHNFALDHYTSYTSVYTRVQQLKKIFKDFAIEIDKSYHLVGDETNIRYVLTRIFSFVLTADCFLYEETVKLQGAQIVATLAESGIQLPRNSQTKLRHLLAISSTRQAKGHQLVNPDENKQKVLTKLAAVYHKEWQLIASLQLEPNLAAELLAYLYTNAALSREKIMHQILEKRISRLNERFLNTFIAHFQITDEETTRLLLTELNRLHFELTYFPLNAFYSFERFDVSFFEESYIEFFLFCREYLMDERFMKDEGFLPYRPYVFFKYLMILVNQVAVESIMSKLTICIDFSFGQEYNEFIKKNLSFFVNLNIEFKFVYDGQTDIIITNLNSEYKNALAERVVWLEPPRPTDWANLGNRILEIRKEKHKRNLCSK